MIEPFDPINLHPRASLNRLRVTSTAPAEIHGKTGYELVSARAWSRLIRDRAAALGLTDDEAALSDRDLPIRFDRCMESSDPDVCSAAADLARQFAQNMCWILLTLKRADSASCAARPDWDKTYWNAWQRVDSIIFGGGLLSGHLGRAFISYLADIARQHSLYRVSACEPRYCAAMPLIGGARTVPPDSRRALIFDFGGSYVKRAIAVYADGALICLHQLSSVRANVDGSPQTVFDFLIDTIASTWTQVGAGEGGFANTIPVSIAAYVRDGQPCSDQGRGYAGIGELSDNASVHLSRVVSSRLNESITIRLLHDGTAAAIMHAGATNAAVIMLGTAMGIGFPPLKQGLRPIKLASSIDAT